MGKTRRENGKRGKKVENKWVKDGGKWEKKEEKGENRGKKEEMSKNGKKDGKEEQSFVETHLMSPSAPTALSGP